MIKLYQFPSYRDLPNLSPFCLKLETYLRMAKLPYETVNLMDPRKAPKGKLPYIEDTRFIIEYLKSHYGDPLDQHLSALQKAQALVLQRLLDEHLYWVACYFRWMAPAGWAMVEKIYFKKMPAPLRWFLPALIRKKMKDTLYKQGVGRHTPEEIYHLGKLDLQALAEILGDQPYFMGNQATSIDACAFGLLFNIISVPFPSPLQEYALTLTNLVDYCERIKGLIFAS